MKQLFSPDEVAKMFGVSRATLVCWRKNSRYKKNNSPLLLFARLITHNEVAYHLSDLEAFANRNERYRLRFVRYYLKEMAKEAAPVPDAAIFPECAAPGLLVPIRKAA